MFCLICLFKQLKTMISPISISSSDLRDNLSDVISRVGYGRVRAMVTRNDTEVAGIVPPEDLRLLQELFEAADAEEVKDILERHLETEEGRKPLAFDR